LVAETPTRRKLLSDSKRTAAEVLSDIRALGYRVYLFQELPPPAPSSTMVAIGWSGHGRFDPARDSFSKRYPTLYRDFQARELEIWHLLYNEQAMGHEHED
jgi:hypothetical protein